MMRQGINEGPKGLERVHIYHEERYVKRKLDYGG